MRRLLGAVLAALVLVGLSWPTPTNQLYAQETQQSANEDHATKGIASPIPNEKSADDRIADYTLALTIATVLMFGANIVLAGFTWGLWNEAKRAAKLTKEAMVTDNRAFVFSPGYNPNYEPGPNGSYNWRFHLQWRNSGVTPTRHLRLSAHCELRNTDLPANFNFAANQGPEIVGSLGPETTSSGIVAPPFDVPAITPENIVAIQTGGMHLFIWGAARYNDAFDGTPEHLTRFAWRVLPVGNPFTFNPDVDPNGVKFIWVQLPRGNCTDNECEM